MRRFEMQETDCGSNQTFLLLALLASSSVLSAMIRMVRGRRIPIQQPIIDGYTRRRMISGVFAS
jgi:hypothetical protein